MPLRILIVVACGLAVLLTYFTAEKIFLRRHLRRIPLRVAVTGTRGKSSVVRLVAAALRASGRCVLARTTGSRPVLIHPDGSEHEIRRTGPPSLLEGKAFLNAAHELGADSVVCELMSINPEYLRVESCLLLRPSLLAVTNVRVDHRDVMGRNRDDIARGLAEAVPPGSSVYMLEEEACPAVAEKAAERGSSLEIVSKESGGNRRHSRKKNKPWDFPENTRLALALASACGVGKRAALQAMSTAGPDLGAFRVWKVRVGKPARLWRCAAAFAANEPESTAALLGRLRREGYFKKRGPRLAILNLRDDRPDRTLQWLDAARLGFFREFDLLLIAGASPAAERLWEKKASGTVPPASPVRDKEPGAFMDEICGGYQSGGLLFGAGNIGGLGRNLVEHWEKTGESCA